MSTHETTGPTAVPQADLRCARCGYGVATPRTPSLCPMCGANRWVESRPWTGRAA